MAAPRKPIPFSRGLDKIPRRFHGWLALFCLLAAVFYVAFGFYVKATAPPKPYMPFVVTPKQVFLWQNDGRNLLLVELGQGGQAPLLRGGIALGPIIYYDPAQLRLQAQGFIASLPEPRPWIICYSVLPNADIVSAFLASLHELKIENIYALSGVPRQWGEQGLLNTAEEEPEKEVKPTDTPQ